MRSIFEKILPAQADNTVRGGMLPVVVFGVYAVISTIRSLIHLLAPDGGAGSIAGLDLTAAGAAGIVFAFGLWGSSQLVLAIMQLVVLFRYRSLIPLMYLLLILETLLRNLVGVIKPATFAHTPPGALLNTIILPLAVLMILLSLWERQKPSEYQAKSPRETK
jgi:hypothetical protein